MRLLLAHREEVAFYIGTTRRPPQTVLGPRRTSFPVFCFIDFALGIQTFGVAIDRWRRKLELCSDGCAREL
jgi:hypothetical protein